MDMAVGFLQATCRLFRRLIAGIIMYMPLALFQPTYLDADFLITGCVMCMRLNLRQGTDESSIFCIAGIIMCMDDKIRISADDIALCIIATILVCMDVDLAFQHLWGIFHCDGRQDHPGHSGRRRIE